jgi:hypothetical protein
VTLDEYLLGLASDFKDDAPGYEFTQFPRDQLLRWINDGICALSSFRPDLFSASKDVKLKPGTEQTVEGCTTVSAVRSQVNARGEEIGSVRRVSDSAMLAWNKPQVCKQKNDAYRVSGFRFDPARKDTFYVEPPVPPGIEVLVRVTCSGSPPPLTLDDLDTELDENCYRLLMVKNYVYAQGYSKESDQTNASLATWHMNLWNGLLRGKLAADRNFAGAPQTIVAPPQTVPQQ